MRLGETEWIGSRQSVAALADELRLGRGAMSLIPHEDPEAAQRSQCRTWLHGLAVADHDAVQGGLGTLAKPAQVGLLHYTIGDEMIARASVAWSPDREAPLVIAADHDEGCSLRWRSPSWLPSVLADVLGAELGDLQDEVVGVPLSPDAMLTFLAIAEAYRQGRLLAQLAHLENPAAFAEEDVAAYLRDHVDARDHRRPLLFVDRLLPVPIAQLGLWYQREESFAELENRGLVRRSPTATDDGTWQLTEVGELIEMGLWYGSAKVGLRLSRPLANGGVGHEVFLLVRSVRRLWLFDLAAREGMITTLGPDALGRFLDEALAVRPAEPERLLATDPERPQGAAAPDPGPEPEPDVDAAMRSCPRCGADVPAGKKFCADCGAPVSAEDARSAVAPSIAPSPLQCRQCGSVLSADARFCRECGTPAARPADASTCPACRVPRSAGAKFCRECGHAY